MFQLINYWSLGSNDALWSQRFSVFVPVQCPLVVRPDGSEKRRNSPKSSNERDESCSFCDWGELTELESFYTTTGSPAGAGLMVVRFCVCVSCARVRVHTSMNHSVWTKLLNSFTFTPNGLSFNLDECNFFSIFLFKNSWVDFILLFY